MGSERVRTSRYSSIKLLAATTGGRDLRKWRVFDDTFSLRPLGGAPVALEGTWPELEIEAAALAFFAGGRQCSAEQMDDRAGYCQAKAGAAEFTRRAAVH